MEKTLDERIEDGDFDNKLDFAHGALSYRMNDVDLRNLFEIEVLKEVGMSDHPHAHQIFAKCWSDHHSYGYQAVLDDLRELAAALGY